MPTRTPRWGQCSFREVSCHEAKRHEAEIPEQKVLFHLMKMQSGLLLNRLCFIKGGGGELEKRKESHLAILVQSVAATEEENKMNTFCLTLWFQGKRSQHAYLGKKKKCKRTAYNTSFWPLYQAIRGECEDGKETIEQNVE